MERPVMKNLINLLFLVLLCLALSVSGETDQNDFEILVEFRKGLKNPELLRWPSNDRDPCGNKWNYVFCSGSRIGQIQVQSLGLAGPLPQRLNQLSSLSNVGLQGNHFIGPLPSFSGLSNLKYAYLGSNNFSSIPSDFFAGLTSLEVFSLERNLLLNQSTGWSLPQDLQNSAQLSGLYLTQCNLAGPMPEFLGALSSLSLLQLSYNRLTGEIPAAFFGSGSTLRTLHINSQTGAGLSGSIDFMTSLLLLEDAKMDGNSFTGLIPGNLTALAQLKSLHLENNKLMGPIPKVGFPNFTYSPNCLCQSTPGVPCSTEVTALLDFLGGVNYPSNLVTSWVGNDPCGSNWIGVRCTSAGKVYLIYLSNQNLNGSISASLAKLDSLADLRLGGNNINGSIPEDLTNLKFLTMLNVSGNNLSPPIPKFNSKVRLLTDKNPLLDSSGSPVISPPGTSTSPGDSLDGGTTSRNSPKKNLLIIVLPIIIGVLIVALLILLWRFWKGKGKGKRVSAAAPTSIVVQPRNSSDQGNMVKVVVATNPDNFSAGSNSHGMSVSGSSEAHVIESGNLVISVQVLRSVTQNFTSKNVIGRGGFGVVYKGEWHDGSNIAVKRMEAAVMSDKSLDQFQAEIVVLSKVRHRNLVSLLGFSVEDGERLLVYEYMSQGALSQHLFQWEMLNLEPLTWKKRLVIALDVARGMEYLHSLANECFIHRDLKSPNILLGDDYRAKVSDFGLVKLAPEGKNSMMMTAIAGTFGYLAPEYPVTGKITTKCDVYSFGVVLMELITGQSALDMNRPEERRHLPSWFSSTRRNGKLMDAIDPVLDVTQEGFESISTVAELAGHCTASDPRHRPDMGHAVNVLAPMVDTWSPSKDDEVEDYLGTDLPTPQLHEMVMRWQSHEGTDANLTGFYDSKGSLPPRPPGFADSFKSNDAR